MTPLERACAAIIDALRAQGDLMEECGAPEWAQVDGAFRVEPVVRAVLAAIREPEADAMAAMLACALADSAAPDGYADVSGADQARAAKMSAWMADLGWVLVKYPRDLMIDAALSEGAK